MNFLKKIFGSGEPLAALRRAMQQERWADALAIGEDVDRGDLDAAGQNELEEHLAAAGNALAELNLAEGDACLRGGNLPRAREHFRLAAAQARDENLALAARQRLEADSRPPSPPPSIPSPAVPAACSGGCHGAAPEDAGSADAGPLDLHTRLELIVAGYPAELASRCIRLEGPFLDGFLLAHEGRTAEALEAFGAVTPERRDDLFHFERGALLARVGRREEAIADLQQAVTMNPRLVLALEALIDLELERDAFTAESRLRRMLAEDLAPAFAHSRLAFLLAGRERLEEALEHAERALAAGGDAETVVFAAALLERLGRLSEAEGVLARLPAGGCGGKAPNLPLAEFWLRHRKNLDRALEAFAGALRHDGNPRWRLRIAEVYLARGRREEGESLLRQLLAVPGVDPEVVRAATVLLAGSEPK
jgi:tetratricopeptide (TPR) repeat protein